MIKNTDTSYLFQLSKKKVTLVFMTLWLHISLLDLFLVTRKGPRFLWHESLQFDTLAVHLTMAALATLFFYYFSLLAQKITKSKRVQQNSSIK